MEGGEREEVLFGEEGVGGKLFSKFVVSILGGEMKRGPGESIGTKKKRSFVFFIFIIFIFILIFIFFFFFDVMDSIKL